MPPPLRSFSTQESPHKVDTTLHSLSSKLILALSTYTKHVQVYGLANLALGWLGYDLLSVLHSSALPHTPANSNGRVEGV
jgi:hypothetical protein